LFGLQKGNQREGRAATIPLILPENGGVHRIKVIPLEDFSPLDCSYRNPEQPVVIAEIES
jgi:hypothetical protein